MALPPQAINKTNITTVQRKQTATVQYVSLLLAANFFCVRFASVRSSEKQLPCRGRFSCPALLVPAPGAFASQTAKFKTANPMGQVPVLLADGKPISQSVAIMEYLEEKYPEPRMLPADPYQRAKCREVVELLVSGVQPLQSIGLIPLLGRVEWKKWADRTITRGFAGLWIGGRPRCSAPIRKCKSDLSGWLKTPPGPRDSWLPPKGGRRQNRTSHLFPFR
ncbi:maleylacetoacetate isomerase-like isoform X5 [Dermacentor andersoni]|uniref:maleylacetoacetate isomerase-like isoform X5 n=1 Tax=Dermacentor andersoni TaxID=34620 RepID=UPI003B3AA121